jgi:hypothetical protein
MITVPTGQGALYDNFITLANSLGYFPSTITYLDVFFPAGMPKLSDRDARKQGQWGVALRYFADAIRTEFGAYYVRFHSKQPTLGFVADPSALTATTFIIPESFGPFVALVPPESLPPNPVDVTVETAPRPVGYFREYSEDINIVGVSAATELFGIAWGAELSYTTQLPVAVTTALPNALAEATATHQRAVVSGFVREERLQGHLSAIATIGPGDPYVGAIVRALRISSIAVTGEVVFVDFPNFDESLGYATVNNTGRPTEFSWAYATLIRGDYDNPLGVPITVTPRVSFSHAVNGTYPGGQTQFIKGLMGFGAGVNVDYLGVWQFDLSYTGYFGGGERNPVLDRDFVSFSVTRSF